MKRREIFKKEKDIGTRVKSIGKDKKGICVGKEIGKYRKP